MYRQRMQPSFIGLHRVQHAVVCAVLCLSCTGVRAQSQLRPFSADQIQITGKKTTTGKVYFNEKAVRVESEQKGKESITILRLDHKAVWVLTPAAKTYLEMGSLGATSMEWATSAEGAKVQRDSMGSEQVGAYHCEKYRVQTTYEGHVYTSIEWDAKELDGFPVKQQGEKGEWSKEYQNVKFGPQDPSLFEIPPGYQKIDLGGMFKPKS